MTTKTDEQERAAFEAWYEKQMGEAPRIAEDMYTPFATACWEAYQAGRAAPQSQPQETIAYVTRNVEGDPAMLFFDIEEARLYCEPGEEPEALVLAGSGSAMQSRDREDAERFRWLTEDHTDAETRTRCREILERMAVMSYSAACVAIDHARRIEEAK